ncbi:hypothetical protein AVEN_166061-1 [Araneus ventricosus]|uniref:Uncharacterized protein n=1 Tax=Araneus ventricosus TaxID=182803 RepID=A0A4Y2SB11_ARAVE|nr:hypothetical protein AVEN_166061-1 [Araneus ventricosus]
MGTVLFADESRFSLNTDSRRTFIRREPRTRYLPSNVRKIHHYGGGCLMVWTGIMLDGRTPLHICNCNSQPPSENHPGNENSVAERVGPIATGNDKLPYFKHEVTLQGLYISWTINVTDGDEEYPADLVHRQPHLVTQPELNDLVRDLELPKSKSQLLGSRLQQRNLLEKGVKISAYRTRQSTLKLLFSEDEGLVFCPNSNELMIELKMPYDPHKWRLFIDSSKTSLEVVLLANGNDLPSVPVAYSLDMKETHENIIRILDKICYYDYSWKLCAELKVAALLTGLQTGYTKYCYFLCEWDSRARDKHYIVRKWPRRETFTPGQKNVAHDPLVPKENIYLPPLYIKLGLIKQFVKAMDKTGEGFHFLKTKFPRLSGDKIKEGIFVGPRLDNFLKFQRLCKT